MNGLPHKYSVLQSLDDEPIATLGLDRQWWVLQGPNQSFYHPGIVKIELGRPEGYIIFILFRCYMKYDKRILYDIQLTVIYVGGGIVLIM